MNVGKKDFNGQIGNRDARGAEGWPSVGCLHRSVISLAADTHTRQHQKGSLGTMSVLDLQQHRGS
jgi:hypothetical protein